MLGDVCLYDDARILQTSDTYVWWHLCLVTFLFDGAHVCQMLVALVPVVPRGSLSTNPLLKFDQRGRTHAPGNHVHVKLCGRTLSGNHRYDMFLMTVDVPCPGTTECTRFVLICLTFVTNSELYLSKLLMMCPFMNYLRGVF